MILTHSLTDLQHDWITARLTYSTTGSQRDWLNGVIDSQDGINRYLALYPIGAHDNRKEATTFFGVYYPSETHALAPPPLWRPLMWRPMRWLRLLRQKSVGKKYAGGRTPPNGCSD